MVEGGAGRVVVVARVGGLGKDDLCAFVWKRGGIVVAAINAEVAEEAMEHLRQHVRAGGDGVQICARDCSLTGSGRGQATFY